MRKMAALLTAVLLAFALLTVCPAFSEVNGVAAPPGGSTALDASFAAEETIRLVPVEPDGRPGAGWMPISLSPDGRTVLWRFRKGRITEGNEIRNGLTLTRDGTEIPLTFNTDKGAGDPYGNVKRILIQLTDLPATEGLSWSGDGRWISLSCMEAAYTGRGMSFDVPVVDTVSGEVWLADSCKYDFLEDLSGYVILSRIDRSGQYLYYLLKQRRQSETGMKVYLCFCRCRTEGGDREVLCETLYDDNCAYDVANTSNLYEAADGSWLLAGTDRLYRGTDTRMATIRFAPSGDKWTQEVIPTGIPYGLFQYNCISRPAGSGYGLTVLSSPANAPKAFKRDAAEEIVQKWRQIFLYVNLVRVHPGNEAEYDLWCLRKTGDEQGTVEMVPAEDFLWAVKILTGTVEVDETQAAAEWLAANGAEEDDPVPDCYGEEAFAKDMNGEGRLLTTCAAVSPDGCYALVNAGANGEYHLYLVSLETMKVLPVEAPEGVAGIQLSNSGMGKGFRPGIIWNQDGTLLIAKDRNAGQVVAFRLETGDTAE